MWVKWRDLEYSILKDIITILRIWFKTRPGLKINNFGEMIGMTIKAIKNMTKSSKHTFLIVSGQIKVNQFTNICLILKREFRQSLSLSNSLHWRSCLFCRFNCWLSVNKCRKGTDQKIAGTLLFLGHIFKKDINRLSRIGCVLRSLIILLIYDLKFSLLKVKLTKLNGTSPWKQDVNWTYLKRLEDVQGNFFKGGNSHIDLNFTHIIDFTYCSRASVIDFEKVNAGLVWIHFDFLKFTDRKISCEACQTKMSFLRFMRNSWVQNNGRSTVTDHRGCVCADENLHQTVSMTTNT